MQIDPKVQAFAHSAVALTRAWDESRRQLAAAFEVALASDFAERQLDAETKAMFTVHPDDTSTETQTTYKLVADAITEYVTAARDRTDVRSPINIRSAAAQARLAECITAALVGDEVEQPEWERPELTLDERTDARRVHAVITALRQCGVASGVSEKDTASLILDRLSKVDRDEQPETAADIANAFNAEVFARGHGTRHDAVVAALAPYDHAGDTTPLADIADEILSALNQVDGSPRLWALPPAPGPAITEVRDKDGDIWDRVDHGWTSGGCTPRSWRKLVAQFGPLTEVATDSAR